MNKFRLAFFLLAATLSVGSSSLGFAKTIAVSTPNLSSTTSKIILPVIVHSSGTPVSVKMPWELYSDYLEIDGTGDLAKTAALLAPLKYPLINL